MKVLSIGNSFSQDAHRYIKDLANEKEIDLNVYNLYIGGCSLERHYENFINDKKEYIFEPNGKGFDRFKNGELEVVTLKTALEKDCYDVVTIQQVSHFSFDYPSYFPYVNHLIDFIKKYQPTAKIYLHVTWPYEDGCERLGKIGYKSASAMFRDIEACNYKVFNDIKVDGIIPSGKAIFKGIENGFKMHRDTLHISLGLGRFMAALVWIKALTKTTITSVDFNAFDEEITQTQKATAIKIVNELNI